MRSASTEPPMIPAEKRRDIDVLKNLRFNEQNLHRVHLGFSESPNSPDGRYSELIMNIMACNSEADRCDLQYTSIFALYHKAYILGN